jgi:hypothetical protein
VAEEASNKFFTEVSPPAPSHRLLVAMRFPSLSQNSAIVSAISPSERLLILSIPADSLR